MELNGLEHGFVFCLQEVWVWSLAPHSEVHKTKSCLPELYNLNLKAFTKWNKASACTVEKENIAKKASGLVKNKCLGVCVVEIGQWVRHNIWSVKHHLGVIPDHSQV